MLIPTLWNMIQKNSRKCVPTAFTLYISDLKLKLALILYHPLCPNGMRTEKKTPDVLKLVCIKKNMSTIKI